MRPDPLGEARHEHTEWLRVWLATPPGHRNASAVREHLVEARNRHRDLEDEECRKGIPEGSVWHR